LYERYIVFVLRFSKINGQLKLIFVLLLVFVVVLVILLMRGIDSQKAIIEVEVSNIKLTYYVYTQMIERHAKPMHILIENEEFIDDSNFVDEFRVSTPLMRGFEDKKPNKYSLILKFINKHETQRELHGGNLYEIEIKEERIELFGKVGERGYILISKDISKAKELIETIYNSFVKIFVFLTLLMIIIIYLIRLSFAYQERKKELEEEHKELEEDVKKMAFVDILTKAHTRLKFSIYLTDLIETTKRFEQPFGLILFDIDNFKKINDTFGHDYGDVVLVELAKKVKSLVRKSDIFARWGGEEFVVVLPQTDLKSSLKLAEKIRLEISKIEFDKLEKATCSFGVVEYKKGDDEDSIVKRADEFLYKAKKAGKNCVRS